MEKVVHIFMDKEEADRFDRDYYRSLTPKQRVDILLQLVKDRARLQKDWKEFVALLNATNVEKLS